MRTGGTGSRRVFQALSLAVAAATLSAQLAAVDHLGLVRHGTCEHGEAVDLPASAGGAPVALAASGHLQAAADPASLHGHDHCALSAYHRARSVDGGIDRPAVPGPTVAVADPGPPRCALPARLDLVLLAPKTSPPG